MDKKYTFQGWIEAFTIFDKYCDQSERAEISSGHDVLYAGPNPNDVSQEDLTRLKELGWDVAERHECFYRLV